MFLLPQFQRSGLSGRGSESDELGQLPATREQCLLKAPRPNLPPTRLSPGLLRQNTRSQSKELLHLYLHFYMRACICPYSNSLSSRYFQVLLENAFLSDNFTIKGTVRVMNMDFYKSVYIRYTLDEWKTFTDFQVRDGQSRTTRLNSNPTFPSVPGDVRRGILRRVF
jgi:hypothetical protein